MLRLLRGKLRVPSPPFPFLLRKPITTTPNPSTADANLALVLGAFRSHGVPDDLSEAIVSKQRRFRTMNPEKTLTPKLAFLRSEGFSGPEVAEILLGNPSFLNGSLDRCLTPSVNFLKSVLPSKGAIIRVLKRMTNLMTPFHEANILLLRARGVPESTILNLLASYPRSLTKSPPKFAAAVEQLEELGVTHACSSFSLAVGLVAYMSTDKFRKKLELYRDLGWSKEELLTMLRRFPACLGVSDEVLRRKVEYFRERIGWGPEFLHRNPVLLLMNLEKRIIPRTAVLNVLMSKGLIKKMTPSAGKFSVGDERFYKSFVMKYVKDVPEVEMAYRGEIEFCGWDWLKDGRSSQNSTFVEAHECGF